MSRLIYRREEPENNLHPPVAPKKSRNVKNLPAIQSLIKPKQRKQIVDKIFRKNNSEFEAFLNELNSLSGWKEAFSKLDEEFTKRKIRTNKDEAVLLTNIVYRRFYPNDDEVVIE